MKKEIRFFLLLFCYTAYMGCSFSDSPSPQMVTPICAQFNEKQLTIKQAIEEIEIDENPHNVITIENYCKKWIKKQILLDHAISLNLDEKDVFQKQLKNTYDFILIQHLREFILSDASDLFNVSDEEAKSYFQENREQFILHEKYVRFRHFESPSLRNARVAKAQLLKGVAWDQVVKKYGKAPDIRIEQAKQFLPISGVLNGIPILNQYLKIIGINEISPIRKIDSQYHFVQLLEETPPGGHPDIKWLLRIIKDWLEVQKRKKEYEQYVVQIEKQAYINHNINFFNVNHLQTDSLFRQITVSSPNIP